MNNMHFDHNAFGKMQFPLQKLMELNVKTIQSMSYLKPGDLLTMKKPGDLFEKNMDMLIHNTNMALNYMKDTLGILEGHWDEAAHQHHHHEAKPMHSAKPATAAKKTVKKAVSSAKTVAKKAVPNAKTTVKAAAKVSPKTAKTAAKKTVKSAKPVVQQSKAKQSHGSMPVKHEMKTAEKAKQSNVQSKDVGHNLSKVSTIAEKSPMNDLSLLNKGNFHN